ncbi:MAG: hypothetical protein RR840_03665 [Clostridium sp.]
MEAANWLFLLSMTLTIVLPALIVGFTAFLGYVFFSKKSDKDKDKEE